MKVFIVYQVLTVGHGTPKIVAVVSTEAKAQKIVDKHTPKQYRRYYEPKEVW